MSLKKSLKRSISSSSSFPSFYESLFPDEVLLNIFLFLSNEELFATAKVCLQWNYVTYDSMVWRHRLLGLNDRVIEKAEAIGKRLSEMKNTKSANSGRLEYLSETIGIVCKYFSKDRRVSLTLRLPEGLSARGISTYCIWVGLLFRQLRYAEDILKTIKDIALNDNFDLMELGMTRYLHQLKRVFPTRRTIEPPSLLIENPRARKVWDERVGADKYFISFQEFYEKVIIVEFPEVEQNQEFKYFLSYFINFPQDNQVSTYKFHQIVNVFGFDEFSKNFQTYVLGRGFLGLVNGIRANEILKAFPNQTYLIRFSRQMPEFLTISCKNKTGIVKHIRNVDPKDEKKTVMISSLLNTTFRGYSAIPMRVDGKVLQSLMSSTQRICQYTGDLFSSYDRD